MSLWTPLLTLYTVTQRSLFICPDSWKAEFIKNERKKLLNYKALLVKSLQPAIYCPFAGFFVEAHPSDRYFVQRGWPGSVQEQQITIMYSKDKLL